MRRKQHYLSAGVAVALIPVSFIVAPTAAADCIQAGYSTVCSSTGEVRGGGPTPPSAGPYYPSYCADPWYCDNGWDMDIVIDPGPGRPGRPGGIGPR